MFVRRYVHPRAAIAAGLAAAAAIAVIGFRVLSPPPPAAGASFSWAPATPSPSARSNTAAAASAAPIPQAPASPSPASSPEGGLQLPIGALFQQLNTETRNTAVGQYVILEDIGGAIRDQITRFLTWISGAR